MDESNSAFFVATGIGSGSVLALSWNMATEPLLRRKLVSNPYAPEALQIIIDRFPVQKTADVIKAVILAEPEGKYDRSFALLSKEQQKNELCRQEKIERRGQKQLARYLRKNSKELTQVSKEVVYSRLSMVVFGTGDLKEIEQNYQQKLRLTFRLSIVNFIENTPTSPYVVLKENPPSEKFLLTLAVATFLSLFTFFFNLKQIQSEPQQYVEKNYVMGIGSQNESRGMPVRLIIPSINVNAAVELVGVSSSGAMDVPKSSVNVGWFDLGPRPGEKGSAVMAGHLDGTYGEDAVFTNLDKLKAGDKIFVEDNGGAITSFIVRESRVYDPGYAEDVFSSNDGVYLNLITCDGVWIGSKKSFSKRRVVFADIVN